MGILEKENRRARRVGHIQKGLLTAALIGGIMLIGGVPAPNMFRVLRGKRNGYVFKHQTKTALGRLVKRGYITFVTEGAKRYARITPAGQKELEFLEHQTALQLQKRRRWDKRWRVVVFDVPECRRNVRDQLRNTMRSSGFYRLQDSVWLYPYDCEDFIALLKTNLHLGISALYMIVEKIENDAKIKAHFDLT
jgi:DNA-binding transcriptional regulator PaaX